MRTAITLTAICAITTLQGADQSKFEVASVKRMDRCSMENSVDPGMITLKGDPLTVVLTEAFKVKREQIIGPSWIDEDCFEIAARMPEGATRDQLPAMLEALLIQRFKLNAHKEDRPSSGYALVVDKNGPKIKESAPSTNAVGAGRTTYRFGSAKPGLKGSMTMEFLARYLSGKGYGPVQDATDLKGKYDIDLSWSPDPGFEAPGADGPPDPAAGLLTAVRESLGLRLEPRKLQVEVLVIDHIERVPSEN